jgi:hypothetical protein
MPQGIGYNVPTVADERQRLRNQITQAGSLYAGNPFNTAFAQIGAGLGGLADPGLRKAIKTEEAVKAVDKEFRADKSKDPLSNEIARLKKVRDAVADIDPNAFAQVQTRLLELSVQQEERQRLRAQDQRAEEKAAREEAEFSAEEPRRGKYILVDGSLNAVQNVDHMNAAELQSAIEYQKQNPGANLMTHEEFADMKANQQAARARIKAAESGGGRARPVEFRRFSALANNELSIMSPFSQLVTLMSEIDPTAATAGTQIRSKISEVGTQVRSVFDLDQQDFIENKVNTKLEEANINDARLRGLVMDLAYAIATSREGGRLTDQDVERAIMTMGGGNPDPRVMLSVVNDLIDRKVKTWDDRLSVSGVLGSSDEKDAMAIDNTIRQRYGELRSQMEGAVSKWAPPSPAEGTAVPGAAAPAQAGDWVWNPETGKVERQ